MIVSRTARTAIALSCILAGASCSGSARNGQPGDAGAGDSATPTGIDGGSSDVAGSGALPGADFCNAVTQLECGTLQARWYSSVPGFATACEQAYAPFCEGQVLEMKAAIAAGWVTYDPEALATCVSEHAKRPQQHWSYTEACRRIFVGKFTSGQACAGSYSCVPGLTCRPSSCVCETLTVGAPPPFTPVAAPIGAACQPGDPLPHMGVFCDPVSKAWRWRPLLGQTCSPGTDHCFLSWCNGGTCAPVIPPGGPCTDDAQCVTTRCTEGQCTVEPAQCSAPK